MRVSKGKPNTDDASVRASISFPRELYQTLEQIAHQKKVSLAWIVRDAAEQYVSGKWPLLSRNGEASNEENQTRTPIGLLRLQEFTLRR